MWQWFQDHQKLSQPELRCESPKELRGAVFLDLQPPRFCGAQLVVALAIQDIQPDSVLVSWQGATGPLRGYRVAYHKLDHDDKVRKSFPLFY